MGAEKELREAMRTLRVAERRVAELHAADAPRAQIEKARREAEGAWAVFQRVVKALPPG